jgi:MFS family permease
MEMGWAFATQAIAAILAPLAAGQVADRWLPAERCISFCALAAGVMLLLLAELTTPAAVFWTALAFWLMMVPAISLGTALCFSHLERPDRDFGPVRMCGTLGWMGSAYLLFFWFQESAWLAGVVNFLHGLFPDWSGPALADIFRLGGVMALALGFYAWTLPHTPPRRRAGSWLAPAAALHLLRQRSFAIFCACSLVYCCTLPFYQQVVPLLLRHAGLPTPWLFPIMTIGQFLEIVSLFLLPMLLLRLGLRGTMILGLSGWGLAFGIWTVGCPTWLAVAALCCNGLCVCGFLVGGQVFVNSRVRGDIRASAQGLLTFVNGLGLLLGNLLVGWVRRQAQGSFGQTLGVGTALVAALLAVFIVGFREDGESRGEPRG